MIDIQDIPDRWSVRTVSDVCGYIQRGKQPEYDDENGIIKIINQRCIYWDGLRLENARKLDKESEEDWQEYRYLQHGDVLVNSTGVGTLGRIQIWDVESDDDYVVDGHVTILMRKLYQNTYTIFYPPLWVKIKLRGTLRGRLDRLNYTRSILLI
jgi:type I restriction enzyme S subunit